MFRIYRLIINAIWFTLILWSFRFFILKRIKKGEFFMIDFIIDFLSKHLKEIIYCIIAIFITVLGISCLLARARDEIYSSTAIKIFKTITAIFIWVTTICSLPAGIIYLFFFSHLAWWGQIFLSLLLLFVWFFFFFLVCAFFSN